MPWQDETRVFIQLVRDLLQRDLQVAFRVTGDSMWPILKSGDVVVIGPVGAGPIAIGAIVLYQRGSRVYLHRVRTRVVGADGTVRYRVAGDGLRRLEPDLDRGQILGRAVARWRKGRKKRLRRVPGTAYQIAVWLLRCLRGFSGGVVAPVPERVRLR